MSPRLVIFLIVCLGISASVEGPGFTMVPADTPIIRKSKGLLFQNEAFIFSLGFQNEAFNFHQNTSVTQTAFKWHLNDAFLFDSQSKITPKIHCQFGKISYLYIVVKMPFCTLFHLLS